MDDRTGSSTASTLEKQPQADADEHAAKRLSLVSRVLRRYNGSSRAKEPTTGISAEAGGASTAPDRIKTRDFGFLPIPRRCRHDPAKPFELNLVYTWLFAAGATITVSNIYYNQPILVALSDWYSVPYGTVTRVASLVQAGYLCGLLFISPMGDLVPRRPLLLTIIFIAAGIAFALARCPTFAGFQALHFLAGFFNVTPQILIPLTADLAHPARRAASVSIVLSGLICGMVVGRFTSGIMARYTDSPLNVYFLAGSIQVALLIVFYFTLPAFPKKKTGLNYPQILWSMVKLFCTESVLFQACWIGLLSCAIMVSWWTCLTFLLSDAPYSYNTFSIGLFSLTGICSVVWAPWAGKIVDRLLPSLVTFFALVGHMVFQAIALGGANLSLGPVVLACIMVDICHQTLTISQQARFFAIDPKSRARVNAVYMSFVFAGQSIGSSVGPHLFLAYGYRACYALSVAWAFTAIVILLIRGPHAGKKWVGWNGKYTLKRLPVEEKKVEESKKGDGVDVEAQRVEGVVKEEAERGKEEETVVEGEGEVEVRPLERLERDKVEIKDV
ncbi:hypothetical protein JCM8547_004434 [Rhodosporidiobolus lusitaniae]